MKVNDCSSVDPRNFCNCPVEKCPRHPGNHNKGCDPCIHDNLKKGKMPACFFRVVYDDVSEVADYSIKGFIEHYLKHEEEYREKYQK